MEEVKRIPINLVVSEFLLTFEYETRKGHRREQQRHIKHLNKEEAKKAFGEWYKGIRTMSNVKILDITELKDRTQVIVL
ncbi:hypothetical protein [Clostridium estertheticum]|uniref:hypothetical protein n=1 Tax=Clostridium estertheticum TaxID=238834 RepID=UPI001C0C64C5|nr:hypothetical protein [Clostridium estertheticum]MBU3173318.1 hypothetical protein [Clostridium estertheticum]